MSIVLENMCHWGVGGPVLGEGIRKQNNTKDGSGFVCSLYNDIGFPGFVIFRAWDLGIVLQIERNERLPQIDLEMILEISSAPGLH